MGISKTCGDFLRTTCGRPREKVGHCRGDKALLGAMPDGSKWLSGMLIS